LLIATGPRTGSVATEAFFASIEVPAHSYLWGDGGENPYAGYLALADEIVVTSDSISMAHEASLTGKPVHLFALPAGGAYCKRMLQWIDTHLHPGDGAVSHVYRTLVRQGWICPPRTPAVFHAWLLHSGRAVLLGEPAGPVTAAEASTSTERAVAAVHTLLDR